MKKRSLRIDGIWLPALLFLVALASQAQTVTTLATFTGSNGAYPEAGLMQGTDGNFYGTTSGGIFKHQFYPGTAFKMTPDGTLTTIAELGRHRGTNTVAGLVQATNGYFYGAIREGGPGRSGTIFAISPADILRTLYHFCLSECTSEYPTATLMQALDGDLYSTAYSGAIYKMTPGGALTFLHYFSGPDGAAPWSGVIQAMDGNFYGTTQYGGAPCAIVHGDGGCGTVYKMTPDGTVTTLHSFCAQTGCPDGAEPFARVIQATDGSLYGATFAGGGGDCTNGPGGCGVAFKITTDGAFTTLAALGVSGAITPQSSFVQGTDGNFYDTGFQGVFQMTPTGVVRVLYLFVEEASVASVIQATDGNFYGTTQGGVDNAGTVFRFSRGLGPFVKVQPPAGLVGRAVTILGTNLAGAASVTFNGTPVSSFTINATNTAITTTVPAGASTGYVEVVTLTGTLKSNVEFRVKI